MSGCLASAIQEAASSFKWSKHTHLKRGTHTPIRFIFGNFNDIVDETSELNGIGTGPKRQDNPLVFAGGLIISIEAAILLVDDAMTRAVDGAIEI
eukprot:1182055-Pyramimonas_sp.AAC.1